MSCKIWGIFKKIVCTAGVEEKNLQALNRWWKKFPAFQKSRYPPPLRGKIMVRSLTVSFQLENVPFNIKSFECNDCSACLQTIMIPSFCFWVFEKRLIQENCLLFCKKYEKESIILTVSFQLENVPFNIKLYRFECNDYNACSQTIMTHHFVFGYSRKG